MVRILPPPRLWIGTRLRHAKPSVFSDSRDAKNDSILAARREMQLRTTPCTEPAWALQTAKAIGQICEKPWGNQGFLAERTGTELFHVFPVFLKSSKGGEISVIPRNLHRTGNACFITEL
jgi:hypothetical protein